ncbi:antitoxin [Pseudoduganella sp. R-31]|uniref:antitoxin n=1 Tax=unclassified Pseudoduganella TaxID=2637179 RepID=UPI003CE86356
MADTAKLFFTGRSQAVRLPKDYRFEGTEVFIRRDPVTGDVILSPRPTTWDGLFALYETTVVPADFMSGIERGAQEGQRDPFDENS